MILVLHNRYRTTGGEERAVDDLAGVAREHLDAARRTFGVAAAAVKNINPGVFNREHQFAPLLGVKGLRARRGLGFNSRHTLLCSCDSKCIGKA